MASSPDLESLQGKLETKYKIYKLRDALRELEGYDDIILDTPPAFHFYTLSALIAAQKCLVPFDCDDFSRRALYGLLDAVAMIGVGVALGLALRLNRRSSVESDWTLTAIAIPEIRFDLQPPFGSDFNNFFGVPVDLEERLPPWLKGQGRGWVTAEYGMLPRATHDRMRREVTCSRDAR